MSESEALNIVPTHPDGARVPLWRRLLRNPLGVAALVILAIMALAAVFGPLIAPYDQNFAEISNTLAPPSPEHLLGTDSAGRDVWSRLLYGAQLTILSALVCAAVAILIGLPAGLIAGYYSGPFDSSASWVTNLLMSLPGIIVLLSVRAVVGPSVWVSMVVFGVLISPSFFRLTRTAVQSVRNELYVDAARVSGLSDSRIIGRHIISVVRAPLIIQTAIVVGVAIAVQSGLEFLGLGDPTKATWGVMLNDGFRNIYIAPLLLLWPVLTIGLTVGALVLLGNALRDALEGGHKPGSRRAPRATAVGGRTVVAAGSDAIPSAAVTTNIRVPRGKTRSKGRAQRGRAEAPVPAPTDHLLEVRSLAIGYPRPDGTIRRVVDDVSLHVDRGEVLGIVGESGSGKSQTAFTILGLLPPEARVVSGSIAFDGSYTVAPGEDRVATERIGPLRGTRISYIPQEPMSNLDPAFTIGSQLTRPMVKVLGIPKAEAKRRALELLQKVGIADPKRTFAAYPHEVSGGMAQRVLIAGAMSCEPDLIIADEPTTALDVTVQADVLDLLRRMQKELDVAVILVTHNFGVVADLADRVVVMNNGRVVEEGPVREILSRPSEKYTQELLDSMLVGKTPMTMLVKGVER